MANMINDGSREEYFQKSLQTWRSQDLRGEEPKKDDDLLVFDSRTLMSLCLLVTGRVF